MIWDSLPVMITVDLLIMSMAGSLILYVFRTRGFSYGGGPVLGRWLLLGGILLTAVFYAVDLFAMLLLPLIVGAERAMSVMHILHLEIRWPVSALSMGMVCAGIFLLLQQRKKLEARIRESENLLETVRYSAIRSETRFRSILEQTPYSIYCFEFDPPFPVARGLQALIGACRDSRLVECNGAFAQSVECPDRAAAHGYRFGDMDSARDDEAHTQLMRAFIVSNFRLVDYELAYSTDSGEDRALQLSWDGVVKDGFLKRIWGAEQDIIEIKKTEAELAGRKLFENLVAEVSTKLIVATEDQLSEELQKCLQLVCDYADADRAALLWVHDKNEGVELLSFWNEHGGPPSVSLFKETFPWSAAQLMSDQLLALDDIEQLPPEAATDHDGCSKLGVKSLVGVPISIGGSVLGALTMSNIEHKRHWDKQILDELNLLATLFGNTVWRIRSKQELDIANKELHEARDHLAAENVYLQQELRSTHGFDGLIGESHSFTKSLRQVEQVAATKTAVLIEGETGTGKELIARALHARSDRNKRPLVKVNCAALPANLIESELFGHEKGAFTGAQTRKRGRFDLAHRGTLFLDEIGDFPIELQGKLLRVLQEGEFERLGGTETKHVDVRLIAATNRNLREAVDGGEFRADLYYRISTFPIELPQLSDRDGDIPLLAKHFVRKYAKQLGKDVTGVSNFMLGQLQSYSWPGNVRELEAVIQRAIIYANGPVIDLQEPLHASIDDLAKPADALLREPPVDLRDMERDHIRFILDQADWVIAGNDGAAARLGLPPSTLRSKMKKLGIARPGSPS